MDLRTEGARDLILAIFRMAVADYLGISYGHDGPVPTRQTKGRPFVAEAAAFLASASAAYLADLVGLEASAIWREARRLVGASQNGAVDRAVAA